MVTEKVTLSFPQKVDNPILFLRETIEMSPPNTDGGFGADLKITNRDGYQY